MSGQGRGRLAAWATQCPGRPCASSRGPERGAGRWARRRRTGRGPGPPGKGRAARPGRPRARRAEFEESKTKPPLSPLPSSSRGAERGAGFQLPLQLLAGDLRARRVRTAGGQLGQETRGTWGSAGARSSPPPPAQGAAGERPGAGLCLGLRDSEPRARGGGAQKDPSPQTLPACVGARVSASASGGVGPSPAHGSPRGEGAPGPSPSCWGLLGAVAFGSQVATERAGRTEVEAEGAGVWFRVRPLGCTALPRWGGRRAEPRHRRRAAPTAPGQSGGGSEPQGGPGRPGFEKSEEEGARQASPSSPCRRRCWSRGHGCRQQRVKTVKCCHWPFSGKQRPSGAARLLCRPPGVKRLTLRRRPWLGPA